MKTIVRLAIVWAIAGLAVNTVSAQQVLPKPAQPKVINKGGGGGNNPKPPKGKGNEKWWVSVGVGGGPNWGGPPPNYGYYGGYNNYGAYGNYGGGYNYYGYNYRKAARKRIRNTGYILYNSIQQANWEGMYNPVLSSAVQHQQYAKFLYNSGNYIGAIHHTDRARYLAWQSLNFNYGSINDQGYNDWDDDDMYGGNYNGGGNGYYSEDGYKKNGSSPGGSDVSKQKPGTTPDPAAKTPSNEELDQKVNKKDYTKEELKGMKLQDLEIE
ncbi:MAG: hypothetical protein Q8M29_17235 [Bacteroidota bacterium]|nr:hypothetical protein [Bacteroidota bacterium]